MSESEESAARIGQVLGQKYRLNAVLGEGGFGAVYAATHTESGESVAVKVLHAHLTGHKEILTRFRREAFAVSELGHPHIVQVLDYGQDDSATVWMAMELLKGRDATHVLREDGPFTVARTVELMRQICDGLQAAHDKNIIHRDLKLDNIFLDESTDPQRWKLLDFGVSKFLDKIDAASLMTRTGTTIGTPYYMSPEQAQGRSDIDHRADVYALGVILFELLTAQRPFEDESYPMLVLKICTEPPPSVGRYRADVPPAFEALIERALAKTPQGRFANCAELKAALEPFATHDAAPRLKDAPRTSSKMATALAHAPTAISVDPITGQPLLPELEQEAEQASQTVQKSSRLGLVIGGVLIAGAALAAGLALAPSGEPEDPDAQPPRTVSLPEPGPPVVQPLRTPPSNDLGWVWLNPLPKAMPAWIDVDVGGEGLIVMCGKEGRCGRYLNGALRGWPTDTDKDLNAVAWIGPAQAIAVGDEGAVQVLLQSGPRALSAGVDVNLRDVVALSTTDALIVGDRGTVVQLKALRPSTLDTGREENLFGAHVRGDTAWAVGQRGVVLRIEGEQVSVEREPSGADLRAVGGCEQGDLYAVGDEGFVIRRTSGGVWDRITGTPRESWTDLACDAEGRAVASGNKGGVLVLSGEHFIRLDSGSEQAFRGIGAANGEATWVVGDSGRLAHVMDNRLRLLTAGHTGLLYDVSSLGGLFVAVGRWGAILRWRDERFVPAQSPTDAALAALALLQEDRLVAVGDAGTVVEITWDAIRLVDVPAEPRPSWRDVVAGEGVLLAVGTDGSLLRGAPGAFVITQVDGVGSLNAVDGTPTDAVAVGAEGAVVLVSGSGARAIRCGESDLRGVMKGPESSWLVGDEGAVYHLEGEQCTAEHEGGGTLHAVGLGPNGKPFAVGDGAAFERSDDGQWSAVEIDTDLQLRGIHQTDRDVLIVGENGIVMRHPRLDAP